MPRPDARSRFTGQDEIRVGADGRLFRGWKEVRIEASIDQATRRWRLDVAHPRAWPIPPGTRVEVLVGRDRVVVGHAESVETTWESGSGEHAVAGRGLAGDLVDCSHEVQGSELRLVSVGEIAEHLAEPYGIELVGPRPAPIFELFALRPGESPWTALDRAARARGMLAWEDGEGRLVIGPPGSGRRAEVSLADGPDGNVLEGRVVFDRSRRFSTYRVVGQRSGTSEKVGLVVTEAEGSALDPAIERHRPLVVVSDTPVDSEEARLLAESEAAYRAAQADKISLVVQGWRQRPGGPLWEPNLRVDVRIQRVALEAELLLQRVTYRLSEKRGMIALLELVRPDAYLARPEVPIAEEFQALFEEGQ